MIYPRLAPRPEIPGLAPRRIAADILDGVLHRGRSLDEQLDGPQAHVGLATLSERDRALVRRIVATALRRLGTLRRLIGTFLERGLPADAPRVETSLLVGAAQIVLLEIPDHAAVDLSVRLVQADRRASRYAGLVNAVLRRIAQSGTERLADVDTVALDTPEWLMRRWIRAYGEKTARASAYANAQEPSLDLTVKADAETWAVRLRGRVLPTGTVRTVAHGPVSSLPGFAEGAWWVQDAAAALPVRLIGDVRGRSVADLCAAPGGKTAQLVCAGADVTAVDRSEARIARLRENLRRLELAATTVIADATEWQAGPFDGVLVDAPCSSTGAIRRHPDIPWRKAPADFAPLAELQRRLLDRAIELVKPGGTVVYCTCSLEPEESEGVIAAALERHTCVRRSPIAAAEVNGLADLLTPEGDLRTLPCHLSDPDPRMAGLDGFYAARLERL
jgi:16S rRNA (cytosine967-C5)-methyltransferase